MTILVTLSAIYTIKRYYNLRTWCCNYSCSLYNSNLWMLPGVSQVTVTDEPPVESVQAVQRDMIGAMQKLVETEEKLQVATKQ